MMTDTERRIVNDVLSRLRDLPHHSPHLVALQPYIEQHIAKPLAIVAEEPGEKHERAMKLESARSLARQ